MGLPRVGEAMSLRLQDPPASYRWIFITLECSYLSESPWVIPRGPRYRTLRKSMGPKTRVLDGIVVMAATFSCGEPLSVASGKDSRAMARIDSGFVMY